MGVLDPGKPLPDASQWLLDEAATSVLRCASRRQNRTLCFLPDQMVLPPGGSVQRSDWTSGYGISRSGSAAHGQGHFAGKKGKGKDRAGKGGKKGGKRQGEQKLEAQQ